MNMKHHIIACLAILVTAASCVEKNEEIIPAAERKAVTFSISENDVHTRGDAVTVSPDIAREVMLAVYDNTGRLETAGYWTNTSSNLTLEIGAGSSHTILAYANLGDRRSSQPEYLDDALSERFCFSWDWMESHGCPMTETVVLRSDETYKEITLKRLLARVTLSIDSLPEEIPLEMESVRVMNSNSMMSLFGISAASSSGDIIPGDYTYTEKGEMVFYVPENMQGTLLTNVTSPSGKTYDALKDQGCNPDVCSYMEITFSQKDTYGVSGMRRFRFYLGKNNTDNFDVERNFSYRVSLSLTSDGIDVEGNWKVDNSDLNDTRELRFTQDNYNISYGGPSEIAVEYRLRGMTDSGYKFYRAADGWDFVDVDRRLAFSSSTLAPSVSLASMTVNIGTEIPIKIRTFDGKISDESRITVTVTDLTTSWEDDFKPMYIAQTGTMTASQNSAIASLDFEPTEESASIIRMEKTGNRTVKVSCIGAGTARIKVFASFSGKRLEIGEEVLEIKSPLLKCDSEVALDVNGSLKKIEYAYTSTGGTTMVPSDIKCRNCFDNDLYNELMNPVFKLPDSGSLAMFLKGTGNYLQVGYVKKNGTSVTEYFGQSCPVTLQVSGSEAARTVRSDVTVKLSNPFPDANPAKIIGLLNNKYYGGGGAVSSNSRDVSYASFTLPGTGSLTSPSNNILLLACDGVDDISLSYSSNGISVKRADGSPSHGKKNVTASVWNSVCRSYTDPVVIGKMEIYLLSGYVCKVSGSSPDFDVSAEFPDIGGGMVKEIAGKFNSSEIFGFYQGETLERITDTRYGYTDAVNANNTPVNPGDAGFTTWGSWCDIQGTGKVAQGKKIYTLHVGKSHISKWGGTADEAYRMVRPAVSCDASRITGTGLNYSDSSIGYRFFYSPRQISGSAGYPFVMISLAKGDQQYLEGWQ